MSMRKIEDKFSIISKVKAKRSWILHGRIVFLYVLVAFWIGFRYSVSLSSLHLEWLVVAAIGLSGWCLYRRLKFISVIILIGGFLLAYHLFIELPLWQQKLQEFSESSPSTWIRGRIVQTVQKGKIVDLRMAPAEIYLLEEHQHFSEITVRFLLNRSSPQSFYRHRHIQIGGILAGTELQTQRLSVTVKQIFYHTSLSPPHPWVYFGQTVHQKLGRRASFYLPRQIFALYSPLILARPVSRSEPVQLFRATGVAHVLTISGLHIGLLFWLGLLLFKQLGRLSERLFLWVHFPQFCQGLTLLGLWGYVALLTFPIPALRALVMLSLMVLIRWMGQAHASLYALLTTAFLFIATNPAVIYNLSFQLSFMAVLYILLALPFLLSTSREIPFWQKMLRGAGNSLLVTGSVLLGIWPILVTHFQQLSLEVFWLNLIMLPLLAFLILPICFAAFFISILHLQALPFGFWESTAFRLSEWVLQGWLAVLRIVHRWGAWATFPMELHWEGWQYLLYYFSTFCLYYLLLRKFKQQTVVSDLPQGFHT